MPGRRVSSVPSVVTNMSLSAASGPTRCPPPGAGPRLQTTQNETSQSVPPALPCAR